MSSEPVGLAVDDSEVVTLVSPQISRFFWLFWPNWSFPSIDIIVMSLPYLFSPIESPVALAVWICQATRGVSTRKSSIRAS